MKTYEEEYSELVEWCKKAVAEADEEIKKLPYMGGGYDDRASYIKNPVWHEWNRRLVQLKIKHNITFSKKDEEMKKKYNL
ncbi:MAG: hypothetical protein FWE72_04080 [Spirochaetaceae bacterium]|nr:hypothetical protein [Spirochaetaceae bacterium]